MADVQVRGKYLLADNTAARGQITFTPRVAAANDATGGDILVNSIVRVTLDTAGAFAVTLQASDDTGLNPTGWTYRVSEDIAGTQSRSYDINVPTSAAGSGIDLVTVAPVDGSVGSPTAFVTLTAFSAVATPLRGGSTGQVLTKSSNTDYAFTWAAAGSGGAALSDVAAVVTASGALVVGKHNPVDATSGAKVMTLADASAAGLMISFEKTDATANTVTLSGNIRGSAGTLPLSFSRESMLLLSKADGSWWPIAGHRTKSSLDGAYQPLDSDLTAIAALTTTAFGRSRLTEADATAALTAIGAQPLDSDLTAIAALTTTTYGRSLLALADAAAGRAALAVSPDIQTFLSGAGNYTIPTGAKTLLVERLNPGAGGGSGRRGAAGSVRCGGGPGGSGAFNRHTVTVAELLVLYPTGLVPYVIGAGGAGAAAQTVDDSNGSAGGTGGTTDFGPFVGNVGLAVGGSGGTASTGAAGVGGPGQTPGGTGSSASTTGGAGTAVGNVGGASSGIAAPGGGITSANVASNGGAGRGSYSVNAAGGAAGVVDTTAPTSGTAPAVVGPGPGPGGGASSITTAAQAGADALVNSGAGGGGGGASLNGNNSGKGGSGGSGYLRVVAYF